MCSTIRSREARLARVTDKGITFELLCWIDDPADRGGAHDAIKTAVYRKLLEAGIEAPPTKHELFVRELPLQPHDLRRSLVSKNRAAEGWMLNARIIASRAPSSSARS